MASHDLNLAAAFADHVIPAQRGGDRGRGGDRSGDALGKSFRRSMGCRFVGWTMPGGGYIRVSPCMSCSCRGGSPIIIAYSNLPGLVECWYKRRGVAHVRLRQGYMTAIGTVPHFRGNCASGRKGSGLGLAIGCWAIAMVVVAGLDWCASPEQPQRSGTCTTRPAGSGGPGEHVHGGHRRLPCTFHRRRFCTARSCGWGIRPGTCFEGALELG